MKVRPLPRRKIFRDPVHDLVVLSKGKFGGLLKWLIDTPEFQRLRRIRQLGLSCLVYPGAEHSRFAHSLGTYEVARRMIEALRERYDDGGRFQHLSKVEKETLVAALLHDVGHGPFSHLLEASLRGGDKGKPRMRHEAWSKKIIEDRFGDRLDACGIDVPIVAELIGKKCRRHLVAQDVISSQLDADRCDYLLRDCHATGAQYGQFDLGWLLHALRIGEISLRGSAQKHPKMCFHTPKGRDIVSGFILAREAMYMQVYIHKTTRAYEAMLLNVLDMARHLVETEGTAVLDGCPKPLMKMLLRETPTVEEYLSLDDFQLLSVLRRWARTDSGDDLPESFGRKCYALVHRQAPYGMIELKDEDTKGKAFGLRAVLEHTKAPERFSFHYDRFYDLPYKGIHYRVDKGTKEDSDLNLDQAIFFVDDNDRTETADRESEAIKAISMITASVHRLYYDAADPKIRKRLRDKRLL